MPPSSGCPDGGSNDLKHWYTTTRPQGATTQKTHLWTYHGDLKLYQAKVKLLIWSTDAKKTDADSVSM